MKKESRFLITTADERTWKFDRPVLFLGEWCRIYERRHIWENMDAIVASPYGLSQTRKDADHYDARAAQEQLFPLLCGILNDYHGSQHGMRFWRIVLGHWLHRYVDVMLNRIRTLEHCLQSYQVSGTAGYANDSYSLAPFDSLSAIYAFNEDSWNNALNVRILDELNEVSCPVEVIAKSDSTGFSKRVPSAAETRNRKIISVAKQMGGGLLALFAKDTDAFIVSSYLPKKEEIKLHLALGQCPQLWVAPKLQKAASPNKALRSELSNRLTTNSGDSFRGIMNRILFEVLPVCFLEGYTELNKLVNQLPWPANPKFIFTSNNFDTNEAFKLWTARKVEAGTTYFIGQHGNNYGTTRNHVDPANEEVTADKFLTWGWTDGLPQHTSAFIFKKAGINNQKYNPKGGLLLIELSLPHRIATWDTTAEYAHYFEEQKMFVNTLTRSTKELLTVRLHAGYRYTQWDDRARWSDFDSSLQIDDGCVDVKKLISKSRLVVHSYDSTGILETLSQNIPTLAFWQNGYDHLRESAKPYYQLLVDAGVVHFTPLSVALLVNDVWGDVEGWWFQDKIQRARKAFCDRYARVSEHPISELKTILLR
ncbi:MAG: transferase [Anaerolineae bacterium]|nr:transferase [Anaerolineae bacterium]